MDEFAFGVDVGLSKVLTAGFTVSLFFSFSFSSSSLLIIDVLGESEFLDVGALLLLVSKRNSRKWVQLLLFISFLFLSLLILNYSLLNFNIG